MNGVRLAAGALFRRSSKAAMIASSKAVPTIWSTNGPTHDPWKYWAGNVAKTAKVGSDCGRLEMWLVSLNALMAAT